MLTLSVISICYKRMNTNGVWLSALPASKKWCRDHQLIRSNKNFCSQNTEQVGNANISEYTFRLEKIENDDNWFHDINDKSCAHVVSQFPYNQRIWLQAIFAPDIPLDPKFEENDKKINNCSTSMTQNILVRVSNRQFGQDIKRMTQSSVKTKGQQLIFSWRKRRFIHHHCYSINDIHRCCGRCFGHSYKYSHFETKHDFA